MNIDGLAVLVVNGAVALLCLAIYRVFPSTPKHGFLGYYLVLMPVGFALWENPFYWVQAVFAVIGLVWITYTVARANKRTPQAAHD
jgi:hypothetical protein